MDIYGRGGMSDRWGGGSQLMIRALHSCCTISTDCPDHELSNMTGQQGEPRRHPEPWQNASVRFIFLSASIYVMLFWINTFHALDLSALMHFKRSTRSAERAYLHCLCLSSLRSGGNEALFAFWQNSQPYIRRLVSQPDTERICTYQKNDQFIRYDCRFLSHVCLSAFCLAAERSTAFLIWSAWQR